MFLSIMRWEAVFRRESRKLILYRANTLSIRNQHKEEGIINEKEKSHFKAHRYGVFDRTGRRHFSDTEI